MGSNYKKLGPYIQIVNERNSSLSGHKLLGVSIKKCFMPSIANIIGTDMSTYKLIRKKQFAYGPVTSRNGNKISIALLEDLDEAMVSQAYTVFEIKDFNELDPEYLMMWFRRPEFDRYARFKSHGSAREIFDWAEMNETELPIPSIEKQREIVREYNIIVNRILLNEQLIQKLDETAQVIYNQWFVNGVKLENLPPEWKIGTVSDLCEYSNLRVSIRDLSLDNYISTENMLQNKTGIIRASSLPSTGSVTKFDIGQILISNIRPYFKKIWLTEFSGGCSNDVLCLIPKQNVPPLFLYQILEKDSFFEYVMAGSKGTKMPRGDKKWIMNYPVVIPPKTLLIEFNNLISTNQRNTYFKKLENQKLTNLKDLLHTKMAKVEIEKNVIIED